MRVWAKNNQAFHARPDCDRAKGRTTLLPVNLEDLKGVPPCVYCYPDAPKMPKVWHYRCTVCAQATPKPCQHNGGVLVKVPTKATPGKGGSKRGFKSMRVWPENAWKYDSI